MCLTAGPPIPRHPSGGPPNPAPPFPSRTRAAVMGIEDSQEYMGECGQVRETGSALSHRGGRMTPQPGCLGLCLACLASSHSPFCSPPCLTSPWCSLRAIPCFLSLPAPSISFQGLCHSCLPRCIYLGIAPSPSVPHPVAHTQPTDLCRGAGPCGMSNTEGAPIPVRRRISPPCCGIP